MTAESAHLERNVELRSFPAPEEQLAIASLQEDYLHCKESLCYLETMCRAFSDLRYNI